MINMSGDMPDVVADMPVAKAMAQHVVNVDPGYADGAALAFLGGFECGFPEMFGGSLKRGGELFEQALKLTERKNHAIQLNYARVCALNGRDKELYVKLLREILESPDLGKGTRMANKIVRHRAERYLVAANGEF